MRPLDSQELLTEGGREPAPEPRFDLRDPSLYLNRELSWLAFNQRVLDQARDDSHPLLERVKFLAITANNLDEFYMVRFAGLLRQLRAGVEKLSIDGLSIEVQVQRVRQVAETMLADLGSTWAALSKELEAHDIFFVEPDEYSPEMHAFLKHHFNTMICPVLTPLAFDPGHPFPYGPGELSQGFATRDDAELRWPLRARHTARRRRAFRCTAISCAPAAALWHRHSYRSGLTGI